MFNPVGDIEGALKRACDWASSPLGPHENWPAPLQVNVTMMLAAAIPSFIVWGPGLTLLYNSAYAPILAGRHPDAFGRSFQEVWPEIWHDLEPLVVRAFAGEALAQESLPLLMQRKGYVEETWFTYYYTPIHLADGSVGGFFGGCIETSEQVLRERMRTAEHTAFWQLSRDLMLRCRFDGVMISVNPAWTEILGWEAGELIGKNLFDLIHPDDLAHTVEGAKDLSEGRGHARFDNRYRHRDGRYRWISWSTRSGEGVINAVGRDFTAERDKAEALARTEAQLRQAQKMEAVGQLTGGLAHDFNNLLAGIAGSLELMNTRISQGRVREVEKYMVAAQGATRRAAALTHRLLAFARRQTLMPQVTNINALVSGMLDLIQRTVGPGIEVQHVGAAGLWAALVDASQLENALLNLCINARDAMPAGGRITIETGNRWIDRQGARQHDIPEGQYLSLCVSDTGTGMTPEVAAKAFDPFFTTKPIGQGTGLGLSMIYGFAKQSGGQVRIYSEVGEGTMVCIYLPRHLGKAERQTAMPEAPIVPFAEAGETVLIVDDEPTVRMLVTDVLEDLGYTAIEAADSVGGLRVLQSDARIDLLITDVGLPGGLNGRQMADAGRVGRPDLKVLFITGFAENALFDNGQLEPGMSVLTKPFAVDTLAARIRELIKA
nr:PAS domain-containing sensor histidine kinase [Methylobacterium sp. PvP109]